MFHINASINTCTKLLILIHYTSLHFPVFIDFQSASKHQASKEAFLLYFASCLAFNSSVLHLPSQYKQILSVGMMVLFTLDSYTASTPFIA